ncbi:MAG: hypothetical protein FWD49_03435 [Firmicutes bacterium]|nr:hypothetical protein [Bacillota bacterium]
MYQFQTISLAGTLSEIASVNVTHVDSAEPTITVEVFKGATGMVNYLDGEWVDTPVRFEFAIGGRPVSNMPYTIQWTHTPSIANSWQDISGTQFIVGAPANAVYYFRIITEAGNSSTILLLGVPRAYTVRITEEEPSFSLVSYSHTSWTNQNVTATFRVTFAGEMGNVLIGGMPYTGTPIHISGLTYEYSYLFTSSTTVTVRATNTTGRFRELPLSVGIIDKAIPQFEITSPNANGVYWAGAPDTFATGDVLLQFNLTGGNISPVTIFYKAGDMLEWEAVIGSALSISSTTNNQAEMYAFKAMSEAGEEFQIPTSLMVWIRPASDNAPIITLHNLPQDRWHFGGITDGITVQIRVRWSVPEFDRTNLVGDEIVGGLRASMGGFAGTPTDLTYVGSEDNYHIYSFLLTERADYAFRAYDADSGLHSQLFTVPAFEINIDSTTPVFTVFAPNASQDNSRWHNGNVSFTFTLTSSSPNGVTYYYSIGSQPYSWVAISGSSFTVMEYSENREYFFMARSNVGIQPYTYESGIGSDIHRWNVNISRIAPTVQMVGYRVGSGEFVQANQSALASMPWTNQSITVYLRADYATPVDTVNRNALAWAGIAEEPIGTTSYTHTHTFTANGEITVQVMGANGRASEVLTVTASRIEPLATNIPVLTVTSPKAGTWQNDNVVFTFSTSNVGLSGFLRYEYQVRANEGSAWTEWATVPYSVVDGAHEWTVTENGDRLYQFRAVTNAGNISLVSSTRRVLIDNSTVGIEISYSSPSTAWISGEVTVTVKVTYPVLAGERANPIVLTGAGFYTQASPEVNGNEITYAFTFTSNRNFTIDAYGLNGLSATANVNIHWIDDITPELIVIPTNTGTLGTANWVTEDASFTFNPVVTGLSGIKRYEYQISVNNGDSYSGWQAVPSGLQPWVLTSHTQNGLYRFRAISNVDTASAQTEVYRVSIDKVSPLIEILNTGALTNWTNQDIVLEVKVSYGVSANTFTVSGGALISGDIEEFDGYTIYTVTISTGGQYTFRSAGLNGLYHQFDLPVENIDKGTPAFNIDAPESGTEQVIVWQTGSVTFTFDFIDSTSISGINEFLFRFRKNSNDAWTEWATVPNAPQPSAPRNSAPVSGTLTQAVWVINSPAQNGEYQFMTANNAGTDSTVSRTYTVNIDPYAPEIEILNEEVLNDWTGEDITLLVKVTYSYSGGSLSVSGGASLTRNALLSTADYSIYTLVISARGNYVLRAQGETPEYDEYEVIVNRIDKATPVLSVMQYIGTSGTQPYTGWTSSVVRFVFGITGEPQFSPYSIEYSSNNGSTWDDIGAIGRGATLTLSGARNESYIFRIAMETGYVYYIGQDIGDTVRTAYPVQISVNAPVFSAVTYSNNGSWVNTDITASFTVTFTDAFPVNTVTVAGTPLNGTLVSSTSTSFVYSYSYTFVQNGSVTVEALSISGVRETLSLSTNRIDKEVPVFTLSATTSDGAYHGDWTQRDITINLSFIPFSPVPVSAYSYQFTLTPEVESSWVAIGSVYPHNTQGERTLHFRIKSETYTSDYQSVVVRIDRANPVFVPVIDADYTNFKDGALRYTSEDITATFSVTFHGDIGTLSGASGLELVSENGLTQIWKYTFTQNGSVTVTATNPNGLTANIMLNTSHIDKATPSFTVSATTPTGFYLEGSANPTFALGSTTLSFVLTGGNTSPVTIEYKSANMSDWAEVSGTSLPISSTPNNLPLAYQFRAKSEAGESYTLNQNWVVWVRSGTSDIPVISLERPVPTDRWYLGGDNDGISVLLRVLWSDPTYPNRSVLNDLVLGGKRLATETDFAGEPISLTYVSTDANGDIWRFTITERADYVFRAFDDDQKVWSEFFPISLSQIQIDPSAPTFTVLAPNASTDNSRWHNSAVSFNFNLLSQTPSGVTYQYSRTANPYNWVNITSGSTFTVQNASGNGAYYFRAVSGANIPTPTDQIHEWYVNISAITPTVTMVGYRIGNGNFVAGNETALALIGWINQPITVYLLASYATTADTVLRSGAEWTGVVNSQLIDIAGSGDLRFTHSWVFNQNGLITVSVNGANGLNSGVPLTVEAINIEPQATSVPTLNVSAPKAGSWQHDNVVFTFTTADIGASGLFRYEFRWRATEDDTWGSSTAVTLDSVQDIHQFTVTQNGFYQFRVVTNANNRSEWSDQREVLIDTNAVELILSYSTELWTSEAVTVTVQVTYPEMAGQRIINPIVLSNGMTPSTVMNSGNVYTYTYVFNGNVSSISVTAFGRNLLSAQEVINISWIDTANPELRVAVSSNGLQYSGDETRFPVEFTLTLDNHTDMVSMVRFEYRRRVGNEDWGAWIQIGAPALAQYVVFTAPTHNGTYEFRAVTITGREDISDIFTVLIDLSEPEFDIVIWCEDKGEYISLEDLGLTVEDYVAMLVEEHRWTINTVEIIVRAIYTGGMGRLDIAGNVRRPYFTNPDLNVPSSHIYYYTVEIYNNGVARIRAINPDGGALDIELNFENGSNIFDLAVPRLSIDSFGTATNNALAPPVYRNGDALFQITQIESAVLSNVAFLYQIWNGVSWEDISISDTNYVIEVSQTGAFFTVKRTEFNDGKALIYRFKAISESGNESLWHEWFVNIDTAKPVIEILNREAISTFTNTDIILNVKVTYSVCDGWFRVLGGATFEINTELSTADYTVYSVTIRGNGTYTFIATGYNAQTEEVAEGISVIDLYAPVFYVSAPNAGTVGTPRWVTDNVTFNFSVGSALSGVAKFQYQLSLDAGDTWGNWLDLPSGTAPWVLSSSQDNGVYRFRAINTVNVVSELSASFRVSVDEGAPSAEITNPEVFIVDGEEVFTNDDIILYVKVIYGVSGGSFTVSGGAITERSEALSTAEYAVYMVIIRDNGNYVLEAIGRNGRDDRQELTVRNIIRDAPVVLGSVANRTYEQISGRTFGENVTVYVANSANLTVEIFDSNGKAIRARFTNNEMLFRDVGSYTIRATDIAGNVTEVFFAISKPNYGLIVGTSVGGGIGLISLGTLLFFIIRNKKAATRLAQSAEESEDEKFVMYKKIK